jgi:hypothetical protein
LSDSESEGEEVEGAEGGEAWIYRIKSCVFREVSA